MYPLKKVVESMHWLLDVEFNDLSRYRIGYGAKNMAIVRRFALARVRANRRKGSVKTRRKSASWDVPARNPLAQIDINLDALPWLYATTALVMT